MLKKDGSELEIPEDASGELSRYVESCRLRMGAPTAFPWRNWSIMSSKQILNPMGIKMRRRTA